MMNRKQARLTAILSFVFAPFVICSCVAEEPNTPDAEEDEVVLAERTEREAFEDRAASRVASIDRRLRAVEPSVDEAHEPVLDTLRAQRRELGNALALLVVTTDRYWPIAKQDLELRMRAAEMNLEQLER